MIKVGYQVIITILIGTVLPLSIALLIFKVVKIKFIRLLFLFLTLPISKLIIKSMYDENVQRISFNIGSILLLILLIIAIKFDLFGYKKQNDEENSSDL